MYGHWSPQPMVTTTSARSASARVSSRGWRSDRSISKPGSRMTATTSGWTRSAGVVPADSARWRPAAARSNSAALICERPALCRQTNRTVAIGRLLAVGREGGTLRVLAAHELVGEGAERRAQQWTGYVHPEVMPLPGRQRGAERTGGVERGARERAERDGGQADRGGDGERGRRADGARISGDAH